MTDNVVHFTGVTSLDTDPIRVLERVLAEAHGMDLEGVIVLGMTKDGRETFASSYADGGDALWLLERSKLQLLRTVDRS